MKLILGSYFGHMSSFVYFATSHMLIFCRFYESFMCCLHLILIDPKCAVSDHVS